MPRPKPPSLRHPTQEGSQRHASCSPTPLGGWGVLFVLAPPAQAGFITYSSSGTIQRPGGTDPWGIGSSAVTTISVTLSDSETDRDSSTAFGFYGAATAASFTINGTAAQIISQSGDLARVQVQDNDGLFDAVTLSMTARFNGVDETVSYLFALPSSTFTLTQSLSPPPAFASTTTSGGSTSGVSGNPYQYITTSGTAFTVTQTATAAPAPPGLLLGLSGVATLGLGRLARRRAT